MTDREYDHQFVLVDTMEWQRLQLLEALYDAEDRARTNFNTTVLQSNAFIAIQKAVEESILEGKVDERGFAEVTCGDIADRCGTSAQAIRRYLNTFAHWGFLQKESRRVPSKIDPETGLGEKLRPFHMWVKVRPGTLVQRLAEYAVFDPSHPTNWGGRRER